MPNEQFRKAGEYKAEKMHTEISLPNNKEKPKPTNLSIFQKKAKGNLSGMASLMCSINTIKRITVK
jgi:hypothetical protein